MSDPLPSPHDVAEAETRVLAVLAALEPGGIVALSGGADSTLVLHLAVRAWGPERVVAATSCSERQPQEERETAGAQAVAAGVEHVIHEETALEIDAFRRNIPDRCFHCKQHLFERLVDLAREKGLPNILDGVNADDVADYRPGLEAGRRLGVVSPLLRAGITKPWVRALSRHLELATWNRPADGCLVTRFPYGTEVTPEGLARVQRAERALKDLGFATVRVRVHDGVARIEVPLEDIQACLAPGMREQVVAGVKAAGFPYVALDIEGFRSGSMDDMP